MNTKYINLFFLVILGVSLFTPLTQSTPTSFISSDVVGATDYKKVSWYASGRFWVMYRLFTGVNFDSYVISTANEGVTWSAPVGCVGNVVGFSAVVAEDGVHAHLLSDKIFPQALGYQYVTCNADGTLTFLGSTDIGVAIINSSSDISIVLDKDGYPWIVSTAGEGHVLVSLRSTTKTVSFTPAPEGAQTIQSVGVNFIEGNIQPLADGSMYAIYVKHNTNTLLYGKKWDVVAKTWGVEEEVSDTICEAQYFSMDSDKTQVYVAYHDAATDHGYYTVRSSTGVWSTSTDISAEVILSSPSIRVDPVLGGATLIWLSSTYVVKLRMLSITGSIEGSKTCQIETGASGIVSVPMTINHNKIGILLNTASTSFDIINDIYTTFRISDMEGSDVYGGAGTGTSTGGLDLVVVENGYYSFEMNATAPANDQIEYMSIKFVNNGNVIQVDYNHTTGLSTIVSGNDYIILNELQHTHYGNALGMKWNIWLKSTCLDAENTDVLTFAERLSGLDFGWNTYGSYFDLYNLGGWVSSTYSGASTTVVSTTSTIATTTVTQSSTTYLTTSLTTPSSSVTTTSVTTSTPAVTTTSETTRTTTSLTGGITITTTSLSTMVTTSNTCTTIQPVTTTVTSRTTSTTVYSTSTTSSTMVTTTKTTLSLISGAAGKSAGGDTFDLYTYPSSMAKGQVAFRDLQNVHAVFNHHVNYQRAWDLNEAAVIPIELGIDYWTGTEYVTGWSVKIELTNAWISNKQQYLTWTISWYFNGDLIGTPTKMNTLPIVNDIDTLLPLAMYPASTSFIVDLWYNKMNSSSVVGGRVTAEYYAMTDVASPWIRWWTGSDWIPLLTDSNQVMFFHNIEDGSDVVISARDIEMSYFWVKMTQDNNAYNTKYELKDWDVLDFGVTTGGMIGINTPSFVATKVHNMAQTGFLNSLWAALQQSLEGVMTAFSGTVGFLGNAAFNFVDSILAYFGLSGAFRDIVATILSVWTAVTAYIVDSVAMIVRSFEVIALTFGYIIYIFTSFLDTTIDIITIIVGLLNGTYTIGTATFGVLTGLGNMWTTLNLAVAFPLLTIWMIVDWLGGLKGTFGQVIRQAYDDVQTFLGVTLGVAEYVIRIFYLLVINLIEFIRGLMPVV